MTPPREPLESETLPLPFVVSRLTFRRIFAVLLLLNLLPLLVSERLPLVDLPQHLFTLRALEGIDAHDPWYESRFQAFFFPNTNVTFFWLVSRLETFLPVQAAIKAVLALYATALPLSVWLLGRLVARNPGQPIEGAWAVSEPGGSSGQGTAAGSIWPALLSLPWVYNGIFHWGFINYLLAIPLFILWFAATLRLYLEETRGLEVFIGLLLLLLFVTHAQLYLTAGLVMGIMSLYLLATRALKLPVLLRNLLVWLPSLVLFARWYPLSRSYRGTGNVELEVAAAGFGATFKPVVERIENIPDWLLSSAPGGFDELITWTFAALLVAWWTLGRAVGHPRNTARLLTWSLALACLIAWFLAPTHLRLQYFFANRYLVLVPLLVSAALCGLAHPRLERSLLAISLVCYLGWLGSLIHQYRAFDQESATLLSLVDKIPEEKTLLGLVFQKRSQHGPAFAYLHAAAYYAAERRGIAAHSFMILPSSPVQFRSPDLQQLIPPNQELRPGCALLEGHGVDADYLLVRGDDRGLIDALPDALELVQTRASWRLFRRVGPIEFSSDTRSQLISSLRCPVHDLPGE